MGKGRGWRFFKFLKCLKSESIDVTKEGCLMEIPLQKVSEKYFFLKFFLCFSEAPLH